MRKIWIMMLMAVGMIACTEKNTPDSSEATAADSTATVSPGDTTITVIDTIAIAWNGANATISGSHDSVSVTSSNGYVTVNSTVKDIAYLLSGSGQGQLTIYGANRHQLILNSLTLTCSDGPAINNQCHKKCYTVLQGTNSLTDGSSYASSDEDRKGTFFSEGQIIMTGGGSLTIKANYKNGLCSDDYIRFAASTGTLNITAVNKGIEANDGIYFEGGKFVINASSEGIESDSILVVSGGELYVKSADDAINAGDDLYITGGMVCAYSTGNDGIDANGNCYIQGGLVYAMGARDPEMAIDANSEEQKQLYLTGGTIVAIGKLERGASLEQTCYQASGSTNTWYALTVGDETFAFKTPSSNASTIVVSGASQPSLYKGVTASGTSIFEGMGYYPGTYTGGSSVSLSEYSNTGGGPGGGPGGGGHGPGWW